MYITRLLFSGEIVSMETVFIKLDRNQFNDPAIEVDSSLWPMASKYHTFFYSRIFYLFEFPAYEQVGKLTKFLCRSSM